MIDQLVAINLPGFADFERALTGVVLSGILRCEGGNDFEQAARYLFQAVWPHGPATWAYAICMAAIKTGRVGRDASGSISIAELQSCLSREWERINGAGSFPSDYDAKSLLSLLQSNRAGEGVR